MSSSTQSTSSTPTGTVQTVWPTVRIVGIGNASGYFVPQEGGSITSSFPVRKVATPPVRVYEEYPSVNNLEQLSVMVEPVFGSMVAEQTESDLMSLPAEIRAMIYKEFFAGFKIMIHAQPRKKKVWGISGEVESYHYITAEQITCHDYRCCLLFTCRLIRLEVVNHLAETRTLVFAGTTSPDPDLGRFIPPGFCRKIKHVELHVRNVNKMLHDHLAQLPNLRTVTFEDTKYFDFYDIIGLAQPVFYFDPDDAFLVDQVMDALREKDFRQMYRGLYCLYKKKPRHYNVVFKTHTVVAATRPWQFLVRTTVVVSPSAGMRTERPLC